jgi:hypothetical protein
MTTMRERLVARFGDSKSFGHIFADEAVMNFAESESKRAVAEALAPIQEAMANVDANVSPWALASLHMLIDSSREAIKKAEIVKP